MAKLSVALVQHNITWLDVEQNLALLQAKTAPLTGVDLIVFSETFATGFAVDCAEVSEKAQMILTWMQTQAQQHQAVICASIITEQAGARFNRLYWVTPDKHVQYYDKRHLFCLGKEGDHLQAGSQRVIFELNGFRVLPQVCYDLRFPVFARNCNDYDVMLNIANWPSARRDAWDTLLKARAIENQSYVLAVNRIGSDGHNVAHNGGTAAYRFDGKTMALAQDNREEVLIIELDSAPQNAYKKAFPAWQDSDKFTLDIG
ncbi:amidohydrolase [Pseudoalteromonas sp. SSDWG2]|uniref:amidohydrolase n=1 Tax=Pseudoalteromonas sp. SSDWG2 TaxID=3139391 RepID=UPI003BAA1949